MATSTRPDQKAEGKRMSWVAQDDEQDGASSKTEFHASVMSGVRRK